MNDITIPNGTDYTLNFNLSSQQIDAKKCDVFLLITTSSGYDYSIKCVHQDGSKWIATIPKCVSIGTKQKYRIEIQFDNMRFTAITGKCTQMTVDDFKVEIVQPTPVKETVVEVASAKVQPKQSPVVEPKPIVESVSPVITQKPTFSIFSTTDHSKELQTLSDRKQKVRDVLDGMKKG